MPVNILKICTRGCFQVTSQVILDVESSDIMNYDYTWTRRFDWWGEQFIWMSNVCANFKNHCFPLIVNNRTWNRYILWKQRLQLELFTSTKIITYEWGKVNNNKNILRTRQLNKQLWNCRSDGVRNDQSQNHGVTIWVYNAPAGIKWAKKWFLLKTTITTNM